MTLRSASASICVLISAIGLAIPAQAQTAAQLEADRAAVFAQMLDAPADRTLMAQYARLSIELRDFEAAAATLERLIDQDPSNATARLELATAYFALGNYPLAEFHLNAAAASGALSPDQLASAEAYRSASQNRNEETRVSGSISAGVISADGDTGAVANGRLTWSIDLGDANATEWVTQIGASTFQIDADADSDTSDRQTLRIRSGPRFQLMGEAFGPRLQPYVQLEAARFPDADSSGYDAAFLGLAYQNAHSATLTSFADIAIGWGELRSSGEDIEYRELDVGITYRPSRETFYRLTLSVGSDDQETRDKDVRGIRVDYNRRFDGPAAFTGPDWRAGAFASVDWLDVTDMGVDEDETVRAAGLSLRAYLNDQLYLETRGTHVTRDGATDSDENILSMQLGLEF